MGKGEAMAKKRSSDVSAEVAADSLVGEGGKIIWVRSGDGAAAVGSACVEVGRVSGLVGTGGGAWLTEALGLFPSNWESLV